jgi:hypothetical protein
VPALNRRTAVAAVTGLGVAGSALLAVGLTEDRQSTAATGSSDPVAAATAPAGEPAQPRLPAEGEELPVPASDVHVSAPAVGLDLPVLPLTPRAGVINPPTLTAAYWIEPYGAPVGDVAEADNTLYLAAHSTSAGEYGFDPLMDPDGGDSTLEPGDVVQVSTPGGSVGYEVERTERYAKGELPAAAEVWESRPGRLVLITCLQRGDGGASTENLVVFAHSV